MGPEWTHAVPPPVLAADHAVVSEDTRERLLLAALRCFANQGYAKTIDAANWPRSQRQRRRDQLLLRHKAGLYRAVCCMRWAPEADIARFADPAWRWPRCCTVSTEGSCKPLREGDIASLCMKLHLREECSTHRAGRPGLDRPASSRCTTS